MARSRAHLGPTTSTKAPCVEDFVFCVGSAIVESKEEEKEVDVRKGQHRLSAPTLGVAPRLVDVGRQRLARS